MASSAGGRGGRKMLGESDVGKGVHEKESEEKGGVAKLPEGRLSVVLVNGKFPLADARKDPE